MHFDPLGLSDPEHLGIMKIQYGGGRHLGNIEK